MTVLLSVSLISLVPQNIGMTLSLDRINLTVSSSACSSNQLRKIAGIHKDWLASICLKSLLAWSMEEPPKVITSFIFGRKHISKDCLSNTTLATLDRMLLVIITMAFSVMFWVILGINCS